MFNNVDALIRQVGELPPLPQAAQKALSLIRNPKSDMADLASVLSMDQVMTSLVLRWVNSPYYGLVSTVSTVQQAVVYLGQKTVQNLVLAASVSTYLYRSVPGYSLEQGDLWKHSIGIATGAQILLQGHGQQLSDEGYHAGLLCDIGKLAFEILLRNIDVNRINFQNQPFDQIEKQLFGIDHAALGAEMVRRWRLPESLQTAIAFHHRPSEAGENVLLASAIHVADATMMMLGVGIGKDGLHYNLDANAFNVLGFKEENIVDLYEKITAQVKQAEDYIGFAN
jgi:HD-like signal output (HDOD) protein